MLSRLLIQYHSVTLLKKKQTQIDRRQDKNTTAYYFYLSRPQLPRPLEICTNLTGALVHLIQFDLVLLEVLATVATERLKRTKP